MEPLKYSGSIEDVNRMLIDIHLDQPTQVNQVSEETSSEQHEMFTRGVKNGGVIQNINANNLDVFATLPEVLKKIVSEYIDLESMVKEEESEKFMAKFNKTEPTYQMTLINAVSTLINKSIR